MEQSVCFPEWATFSATLPLNSAAIYTRWGRTKCPKTAKQVYMGFMAGPVYTSAGGGVNFQCLPSDPEYDARAPTATYAAFTSVWVDPRSANAFSNNVGSKSLPCSVCEAPQRTSKIMIPAKTRCPTSDWTLEYNGFIMSSADRYNDRSPITDKHFRSTYECVDMDAEPHKTVQKHSYTAAVIYTVKVDCTQFVKNCPPYQDGKALSCVVCSK